MMRHLVLLIAFLSGVALGEEATIGETPTPKTEKGFEVEGPDGALRVKYEDLNLRDFLIDENLPVDIEKKLPERLKTLNGKTIRMTGHMFPPDRETGVKGFFLVDDPMWLNFGRRLSPDETIAVRMREGVTTDYIQGRKFDVVGKLTIKSRVRDGELLWLYRIEDAVVIDK